MAKCQMCRAPIMWARTRDKTSVALTLPPVPNGNVWLEDGPDGDGKKVAVFASADNPRPESGRFYRAHFIECEPYKTKKKIERMLKQH